MILIQCTIGSRYPVNRSALRQTAEQFLLARNITHAQVDISVVGKRRITQLNESILKHQGETDVLSFPLHEKSQLNEIPLPPHIPPHLGDIVISYPAVITQAKKLGRRVDQQLSFFVEHGLLHLLGYHHQ